MTFAFGAITALFPNCDALAKVISRACSRSDCPLILMVYQRGLYLKYSWAVACR